MKHVFVLFGTLLLGSSLTAAEYHVSPSGNDENQGTAAQPYRTISAAAQAAQPGDAITVHAGVYRERIDPPRGGTSDQKRIVYQAAPGEKVTITGSEVVKGWEKVQNDTWKVAIPNRFFGDFNPYRDVLRGDWFDSRGRQLHTGCVYWNGDWMDEAATLDDVMKAAGKIPLWFGQVDATNTVIWAQFAGVDPNQEPVEINVRPTVFTPTKTGVNYITLRGFILRNAATPWAPPTAGQIGLVSAYWCKGWIIENNDIGYSKCCGVTLGKYSDEWDNRSGGTAAGYVETIRRASRNGWNQETIGGHVVRNNRIHHCEQAGIVGSLGAVFSKISGNEIHDIHARRLFDGSEMAGIKIHGAVDVEISRNHIYRTSCGIWLDWMAQGTRVSGNLLHENDHPCYAFGDFLNEANHGPNLVDNNIMLSPRAVISCESHGSAYAHNLFGGKVFYLVRDRRHTPILQPHSTALIDVKELPAGDARFYNNVFGHPGDLQGCERATLPMPMAGNVFLNGAQPSKFEKAPLVKPAFNPAIKLDAKADGWYLECVLDKAWAAEQTRKPVTTALLGKASIVEMPFEKADGSPLSIDTDYFGRKRNEENPFPGPFEVNTDGKQMLKVWPVAAPD